MATETSMGFGTFSYLQTEIIDFTAGKTPNIVFVFPFLWIWM